MLSRFSLYDFLAVVIPGVFFLWALATVLDLKLLRDALPFTGGIAETSVIIVIGYITGLLLQGVSQLLTESLLLKLWGGFPSARWLLFEDTRLTKQYKDQLRESVDRRFGMALELSASADPMEVRLKRHQEIFYLCYRSVEKLSELPHTFNAQYGLFRALLTTFTVLALGSLAYLAFEHWLLARPVPLKHLVLALVMLAAAFICYYRTKKRADDFARAVLDVFLVNNPKPGP